MTFRVGYDDVRSSPRGLEEINTPTRRYRRLLASVEGEEKGLKRKGRRGKKPRNTDGIDLSNCDIQQKLDYNLPRDDIFYIRLE